MWEQLWAWDSSGMGGQALGNTGTAFWKSKTKDPEFSHFSHFFQDSAGPIFMYSDIHSRAGLAALLFALIISLVSAAPVPATGSRLSSTLSPRSVTTHQFDGSEIDYRGRMSTLLLATRLALQVRCSYLLCLLDLAYLLQEDILVDDDQLVRRASVGTKIKEAFHVRLNLFSLMLARIGY